MQFKWVLGRSKVSAPARCEHSLKPHEHFTARKQSLRRLCFHRCLSVHRGSVCLWFQESVPPPPPGRHPPPGQTPPWADTTPRQTVNKRAVRIPLECILVRNGLKGRGRAPTPLKFANNCNHTLFMMKAKLRSVHRKGFLVTLLYYFHNISLMTKDGVFLRFLLNIRKVYLDSTDVVAVTFITSI